MVSKLNVLPETETRSRNRKIPQQDRSTSQRRYRKREPVHYGRLVINLVNGLRHTDCLCILLKIDTIKPETEFKCWYDTPTRIHTDQRLEFNSRLFFNYAAY